MKKILYLSIYLIFHTTMVMAADQSDTDSIRRNTLFRRIGNYFKDSNEDKTTTKKFDFSIIGGPHYSSNVKLGLGIVAAGLYRVDRTDLSIPPSNVSLFGDITTSGFFLIGIKNNTYLKGGKFRLDFQTSFYSYPTKYWGIGYDNALHGEESEYTRLQTQTRIDFMYRVASNTYIGANGLFNYIEGKDFTRPEYLHGESPRNTNVGVGVLAQYDSRDVITNPYKGLFLKIEQRFFPEFIGNKSNFYRTEFTGDIYKRVWKGGILAYDLHAMFNYGDVPWTMMALMGGSSRMRGYYDGRFRDNNLIETQVELRQRVYRRNGIAAWVGAGNVFRNFSSFQWSHTLPNYGIGYRWEFKSRVNVRLDYGFGKDSQGFMFNINEAF